MPSKTQIKPPRPAGGEASPPPRPSGVARTGEPLYLQIARVLKDEILSGVHPVGSQLPTEEDLTARFAVSRHTVREALRRLREDSLVASRQGAGTTVVPPRFAPSATHHVMSINDLVAFAAGLRFAIESIRMVTVSGPLAVRAGLPEGDAWLQVLGFRYAEESDTAVCWTEYYINRDFAAVGRLLQRHTGPIFPLIEDLFGQNIEEVEQEIAAAQVSPPLAEGLRVEPGSVVLEVRRAYKMAEGRIAQVTISTHPAARFRHSMTMRRVKA